MTQWADQHSAIHELMEWLPTTFSRISRRQADADMASAAALARCNRLLLGIDSAVDADDREDLVGVFVRPLFETWLTGFHVLFEGHEAWERLKEGARRNWALINQEANLGVTAAADWLGESQGPSVPTVVQKVRERLIEEGDPAGDFPANAYSLVYRSTSLRDAHGGAGPLSGHFQTTNGVCSIAAVRSENISSTTHLLWCSVLTTLLAQRVFDRFQLPVYRRKLDQITVPLEGALEPSTWKLLDDSQVDADVSFEP